MSGLSVPLIDRALLKAGIASGAKSGDVGQPPAADVAGCSNLSFVVVANGTVSAGAVQIEESHDVAYTGTWAAVGTPITAATGTVAVAKANNTAKAVRARISTAVTGGGSVDVIITGR